MTRPSGSVLTLSLDAPQADDGACEITRAPWSMGEGKDGTSNE